MRSTRCTRPASSTGTSSRPTSSSTARTTPTWSTSASRAAASTPTPRTNELVGGTPAYAAPETAAGVPNPASDLYALGCVVFELLTGERPFGSGDARVLAARHATAPRPLVSDIAPDLAVFDDVVARAIARDPAERYASGAEFGRALERAERTVAEPATLVMMRAAASHAPPGRVKKPADAWAQAGEAWAEREDRPRRPTTRGAGATTRGRRPARRGRSARPAGGTRAARARAGRTPARRGRSASRPAAGARAASARPRAQAGEARAEREDAPRGRSRARPPSTRLRPRAASSGRGKIGDDPPTTTHRRAGPRSPPWPRSSRCSPPRSRSAISSSGPGDDLAARQRAADRASSRGSSRNYADALSTGGPRQARPHRLTRSRPEGSDGR